MNYDVIIIGGGAAGLFSAVQLKTKKPSLSVCVIESLDRVGKKLITTGNGRCNITNKACLPERFHGAKCEFISSVLERFTPTDTVCAFSQIGVETVFEEDDKAYPMSYQASSVVDALRFACDELGVTVVVECAAKDIIKTDIYKVRTTRGTFFAKSLVVTGGLYSGGQKLGCDGSVLSILKRMGLKTVSVNPAIVQLKTNTDIVRQLKGIKVVCTASLYNGSALLRQEFGEVLFCDYGLSGPPILQISRNAQSGSRVVLDLVPSLDKVALLQILKARKKVLENRKNENFLTGFLNKRLGQVVLKTSGIALSNSVKDLTDTDLENICRAIKAFEFSVTGNTGFLNSQVSAGGISETELTNDLECKKYPKMFLAGEIINVDGDCGGFNLQWAWSSAAVASDGVIKCL